MLFFALVSWFSTCVCVCVCWGGGGAVARHLGYPPAPHRQTNSQEWSLRYDQISAVPYQQNGRNFLMHSAQEVSQWLHATRGLRMTHIREVNCRDQFNKIDPSITVQHTSNASEWLTAQRWRAAQRWRIGPFHTQKTLRASDRATIYHVKGACPWSPPQEAGEGGALEKGLQGPPAPQFQFYPCPVEGIEHGGGGRAAGPGPCMRHPPAPPPPRGFEG